MKNVLYLDGTCGISGDMFVASLLSLGGDENILKEALNSLRLEDEFSVEISFSRNKLILLCFQFGKEFISFQQEKIIKIIYSGVYSSFRNNQIFTIPMFNQHCNQDF